MGRTLRKRKNRVALDNADFIALLKWMKLKKMKLKMRYFKETGRGIFSKKKIEAGDRLISLPLHLMITPTTPNEALNLLNKKLLPPLTLTIFLMYELHLGEESRYRHYMKVLPTCYSNLFFCGENEVELLPNCMKERVLQNIEQVREQYDKVADMYWSKSCPHCGINFNKIFEYSTFTWAWFTVNTRSVYYKDKVQDSLALAPLLDMFNHSSDASSEVSIDQENQLYILKSLKSYRKNQQIFIKYGSHSNLKLIVEYGFILENNPHDFVEFTFDEILAISKSYKFEYGDVNDAKYKFIKRNNLYKNLTKSKDEFSWNIKALLYVLVTRDENLALVNAKCYSNQFNLDECNEIEAIMKIMKETKKKELTAALNEMEAIQETSHSFSLAKKLTKIYIDFLQ